MDYQDDTLTSAHRNRAASRKLFQQWSTTTTTTTAKAMAAPPNGQREHCPALPPAKNSTGRALPVSAHLLPTLINELTSSSSLHHQQQQPFMSNNSQASGGVTSFDHAPSPSSHLLLLHRSPSGAQRKIRQKAQQQQHQQQQFTWSHNGQGQGALQNGHNANSGVSAALPVPSYRSLIHENGYRSILGGARAAEAADPAAASPTVGQLIDRMNRLESIGTRVAAEQQPSMGESTWLGAGGSIDKMPSSASLASMLDSAPSAPPFGKPTVQVHPLPVPPRHRSMSVLANSGNGAKGAAEKSSAAPPLPPKKHSMAPHQFTAATTVHRRGESDEAPQKQMPPNAGDLEYVLPRWGSSVPSTPSSLSFSSADLAPAPKPKLGTEQKQTEEAATATEHHHSAPLQQCVSFCNSASVSPPSSLSSSPSLTSLQNSLQFAADNPEKHSREQLDELEQRRLQSIDSLAKKIEEREQDRELLERDMDEIGQIRVALFARIAHNGGLVARTGTLLAQADKMAALQTRLCCQLERAAAAPQQHPMAAAQQGGAKTAAEEAHAQETRATLREQLCDLQFVRKAFEERERQIDAEMAEELGDAEAFQEWLFCREQCAKLSAERAQLNERLRHVRQLLQALQAVCLAPQQQQQQSEESEGSSSSSNNNNSR